MEHEGDCPEHGPLIVVEDSNVGELSYFLFLKLFVHRKKKHVMCNVKIIYFNNCSYVSVTLLLKTIDNPMHIS